MYGLVQTIRVRPKINSSILRKKTLKTSFLSNYDSKDWTFGCKITRVSVKDMFLE